MLTQDAAFSGVQNVSRLRFVNNGFQFNVMRKRVLSDDFKSSNQAVYLLAGFGRPD